MNIKDSIDVQRISTVTTIQGLGADGQWRDMPTVGNSEYGGLSKLEYFMLEITKAVAANGRWGLSPKTIVNVAQLIFEELKKRIEDIEAKGLISDQQKDHEKV